MRLPNDDDKEKPNTILSALWSFDQSSMQLHIQGRSFLQNILAINDDTYLIHVDAYLKELCHQEDVLTLAKELPFLCDVIQTSEFEHRIWNKKSKKYCSILIQSFANMPAQLPNHHKFGSFQCTYENENNARVNNTITKLDANYQAILDATPICCGYWTKDYKILACNNEVTQVFNLSHKQEYLDHFQSLSPEYQPDGQLSSEKAKKLLKKAFDIGYIKFEWLHQKLNGEVIPTEIILTRVQYNDDFLVLGYTHDLRELKAILAEKIESNKLNQLMIDANPLSSTFWDKNFKVINCNYEAVRLFDLSNKQEYMERFYDLCPKYQPDGKLSTEKIREVVKKAFDEGYNKFEWMHQKFDGELIPTEKILVRVEYNDDFLVVGYTYDLRELKAIVAEKYEADKLNQIMLDATPLSSTFWDKDFKMIKCNQEAVRLFELSSKQEYMEHFYELSPKYQSDGRLSSEKALEAIDTAFKEGYIKFEWMHQKFDGEFIPTEKVLVRVQYNDDFFVIGFTRDLRELKAMLAEKYEADKLNQLMLDATPLSSTFWDRDYNIINCNQEVIRLFQLSTKQEYQDFFYELSPEYQPNGELSSTKTKELIEIAFKDGYVKFEWMHQRLNGELIPTEVTLVRVQYANDFLVLGYIHDLTELKAALLEMRKADERVQLMLDSTPLACNFWNSDFKNVACNQEAVRLFEFTNKKEYLENFHKLSPEYQPDGILSSEKIPKLIRQAFTEGYSKFEWMHQKINGDLIPTEVTLVRAKHKDKVFIVGYARDLRELKTMLLEISKTEHELRFARDLAEKRAMAKSEFLANMSHEIRTPINAILGMSYILLNTKLNEKQVVFVEKAQYSAKLLLLLINDILDFSKIEAGRLSIEHIEFSISKMLNNFLDILKDQATAKSLSISMDINNNVPDILWGDPLRLEQILMNLSSNALKFTKKGGLSIFVTKNDKVFDMDNQFELLFEIKDTGIGMTQDQMDALFNPFIQADSSTTRKYGGTGLGLAISRSLANLMDGDIWCDSIYGEGSKFSFTLKFEQQNEYIIELYDNADESLSTPNHQLHAANSEKNAQNDIKFSTLKDMQILLVEDNEINQMVATELLICKGIIVDVANNGLEALEAIEKKEYDLVLMDIQMPEMDGLTATKKIRALPKFDDLPVIAMTAHAMPGDREISLNVGMNDHITKPIYPNKLYAMLQKWQKNKR